MDTPIRYPPIKTGRLKIEILERHRQQHPKEIRSALVIAFILRRGKVVEVGYNRKRFKGSDVWTFHAEEAALRKAGRRAKGAWLIVIRIKKDGTYGLAEPCPRCKVMIGRAGIARVMYSSEQWNQHGEV
jgi:deoxycytidylate deaminase